MRCWASASWACTAALKVGVVSAVISMLLPRGIAGDALGIVAAVALVLSVLMVTAPARIVRAFGIEPLRRPRF